MNTPLVSICIPTYNDEDSIQSTIDSVMNQTFQDFEIIITDDASKDRTVELVKDYSDSRIKLYESKQNIGAKENWNWATRQAQGRYIKLLCSDDVLYPSCLEKQVSVFENSENQDVTLVSCKRDIISASSTVLLKGRGLPGMNGKLDKPSVIRKIISTATNPIGEPVTGLFKRETFQKISSYDDSIPYFIDLDFWLKLLNYGKLFAIQESLAGFRVSGSAWSVKMGNEQGKQARQFIGQLKSEYPSEFNQLNYSISLLKATLLGFSRQTLYSSLRLRGSF